MKFIVFKKVHNKQDLVSIGIKSFFLFIKVYKSVYKDLKSFFAFLKKNLLRTK